MGLAAPASLAAAAAGWPGRAGLAEPFSLGDLGQRRVKAEGVVGQVAGFAEQQLQRSSGITLADRSANRQLGGGTGSWGGASWRWRRTCGSCEFF